MQKIITNRKPFVVERNETVTIDKKVYLFIILIAEGSIWIYNIVRHI